MTGRILYLDVRYNNKRRVLSNFYEEMEDTGCSNLQDVILRNIYTEK